MAIKLVDSLFPKLPKRLGVSKANQAYVDGQLLMEDKTNSEIIPATSSVTTLNCAGICTKSFTAGAADTVGAVPYIPIVTGAVCVVADCTNVTAVNQLHKDHLMTDGLNVNNTSTTSTTLSGVFHALGIVGAVGGTKLYGYFIRSGQVTV
jgi:hypothetical protein